MGAAEASCRRQAPLVDRPIFHVSSRSGWINDPNAPLFWKGRYHLFYQHVAASTRWSWGLSWGHASSSDLIHWQHHTPALSPSPHTPDADGCFSGCAAILPAGSPLPQVLSTPSNTTPLGQGLAAATAASSGGGDNANSAAVTTEDMPVLLYTGVVKRPDASAGLRPTSLCVSELCVEQQMAAIPADTGDPYLRHWVKVPQPWLSNPPQDVCLNCFRDPFVLESPSEANQHTWRIMIGAGIRDPNTGLTCAGLTTCSPGKPECDAVVGNDVRHPLRLAAVGTALVYKSKDVFSGWEFEGHLCTALDRDTDGAVWECPLMMELPPLTAGKQQTDFDLSSQTAHTHLFCVSMGRSPAIYWLGKYSTGKFDLAAAAGPFPLDMGDLLYAPNVLANSKDGAILWGWLSELPNPGGTHDYAGCISLPRLLHITADGHLHQQPLPQLTSLQTGPTYTEAAIELEPGTVRHIGGTVATSYFDLELTLQPHQHTTSTAAAQHGSKTCTAGLVLPAWTAQKPSSSASSAPGNSAAAQKIVGQGVVILYDFNSCRLTVLVGDGVGQEINVAMPPESVTTSADLGRYTAAAAVAAASTSCSKGQQHASHLGDNVRILGGQLHCRPDDPVKLRILMDYSLLEVFTGDGQVLSTRVYRGLWPAGGEGELNPTLDPVGITAGEVGVGPDVNASELESAGTRGLTDEGGGSEAAAAGKEVADAVPRGCYVFVDGGRVTAQGVSMSAMQTAWVDDMLN